MNSIASPEKTAELALGAFLRKIHYKVELSRSCSINNRNHGEKMPFKTDQAKNIMLR